MNENMKKRNEVLAQTVIKGLESRNMTGYYAADKGEALKLALEIIGEGSSVAMGGCQSAHEIGLVDALQAGNYNYIDRSQMTPREGLLAAYDEQCKVVLVRNRISVWTRLCGITLHLPDRYINYNRRVRNRNSCSIPACDRIPVLTFPPIQREQLFEG